MLSILRNTNYQNQLNSEGYIQFPLLNHQSIESLSNYYNQHQKEEPQHFYSSTHSTNFEFRKQTSDFIKKIVEPTLFTVLKDFKLLGGAFVVKPANGKGILQAHQDWNLVDEHKFRSYNLWIPLIDVAKNNGAIFILEGSHNKLTSFRGPQIPSILKNIESDIWPYLKELPMKAGEALLYDHALIHGSPPNNSNLFRLGIVIGIVHQKAELQIYGQENNKIVAYTCDENFFLEKNVLNDLKQLPILKNVSNTQPLLDLKEFFKIFKIKQNKTVINLNPNSNIKKRNFFETYTFKNIIAEINYRIGNRRDNANETQNKIVKDLNKEKKDVATFYDEQTDNFIKVYGNVIQAFRTKNINTLLDYQINAIGLKNGMKVLDAGCGVCGPAIYFAKQTGCNIDALTISEVQVEKAKLNITKNGLENNINIRKGDYHQLENYYPENTFDAVYFLESFGHAHNHQLVLDSVWKVLKPGGTIYIKDLFVKKALYKGMEIGIEKEITNINTAYRYNVPDLNTILDHVRKKGYILASLKTIDIPLEEFENLTISNDFQNLTGINKIDNLREYIFPVDFFELKLIKPNYDVNAGNSRYFMQNMYLLQIEKWKEKEL